MKRTPRSLARPFAAMVVVVLGFLLVATPAQAGKSAGGRSTVSRIRLGNAANVTPALIGPSYFLQGNGAPELTGFQAHINQVALSALDIVVLAASAPSSGSKTPECDNLRTLNNVNSCETVTITSATGANDAGATTAVTNAEIVYFAGGDQCNYVGWRGTTVYNAVKDVVTRSGGVGGGSAGLAIQGDFVYDSCTGSVISSEALGNPYHRYISFSYDFFKWTPLANVITDSHFFQRDRMGRLMTFVARQLQDGKTTTAYGLGVNENTAVVINNNGLGQVYGDAAYVVLGDHSPEASVSRQPLTFSDFKIWKITNGGTYNFAARPTSGFYTRSVNNGAISSSPY